MINCGQPSTAGGTLHILEAVRQLQWELPEEDTVVVHLTLIPYLKAAKELKTKPTQHDETCEGLVTRPNLLVLQAAPSRLIKHVSKADQEGR